MLYGRALLSFKGSTTFGSNRASIGGAIYSLSETELTFVCIVFFTHNSADRDGGTLYAIGTNVIFIRSECRIDPEVMFIHNSAENGGAVYLNSASSLTIDTKLSFSHNHASKDGGAIFHQDSALTSQCEHTTRNVLPFCFIRISRNFRQYFYLHDNSAEGEGNIIYGGLMDRCQLQVDTDQPSTGIQRVPDLFGGSNLHDITSRSALPIVFL